MKYIIGVGIFVLISLGGIYFSDILWLFALAATMAFFLRPSVKALIFRLKIPKTYSVIILFVGVIFMLTVLLWGIVSPVEIQINRLLSTLPQHREDFENFYIKTLEMLDDYKIPKAYIEGLTSIISYADEMVKTMAINALSSLINLSSQVLNIAIVVTLTVYFVADGEEISEKILFYLPRKYQIKIRRIWSKTYVMIWDYFKNKALISFGMSLATYILLTLLRVDYAFLLAFIAFILDFIPFFGSIISGAISGIMVLITVGFQKAFIAIIGIIIIQQIEANVVSPKVSGETVGLHPIAILFALLACNKVWGTLGMFIAVPLAGFIKITAQEIYHSTIHSKES